MTEDTNQTLQEILNSVNEKKNALSPVAIEAKKEFDQEESIRLQEDKEWFKENRKSIKELSRRIDFFNSILQKYDLSSLNQFPKKNIIFNFAFGFFRGIGLALGLITASIIYLWLLTKLASLTNFTNELNNIIKIFNFH